MHLLGDVRRRIVDGNALGGRPGHAQTVVGQEPLHLVADPGVPEGQIDESGSTDLHRRTDVVHVQVRDDRGGDLPRGSAEPFGQGKCGIDLYVGELRGPQHGIGVGEVRAEGLAQRATEAWTEDIRRAGHGRHASEAVRSHRAVPRGHE